MKPPNKMRLTSRRQRIVSLAVLGLLLCSSLLLVIPVSAQEVVTQEQPPVQALSGVINAGEVDIFRLSGFKQGQTLYAYAATTRRQPGSDYRPPARQH